MPDHTAWIELAALPEKPQAEAKIDILMITEIAFIESAAVEKQVAGIEGGSSTWRETLSRLWCLTNAASIPAAPSITERKIAITGSVEKARIVHRELQRRNYTMRWPFGYGPHHIF